MIRRVLPWLTLVVSSGTVACAEWAGSELGGPTLSIVPLIGIGSGTVLLDDLDQLHVVVVPISSAGVPGAVADTTVPVDAAGNATLIVPIMVIGRAQPFQVTLQGIRSRDGAVLYVGIDTVVVSAAGTTPPVTVPVRYVGPCQVGSGCVVTVAPQDTTLATGGSLVIRVSVDSALIPVTGVPVALTNLTPGLVLVGPDRSVTALLSPTGGARRRGLAGRDGRRCAHAPWQCDRPRAHRGPQLRRRQGRAAHRDRHRGRSQGCAGRAARQLRRAVHLECRRAAVRQYAGRNVH